MKGIKYFYRDFYGDTASIFLRQDGSCLLTMRLSNGDLYCQRTYSTFHRARIALGKMSEGTARPTTTQEV